MRLLLTGALVETADGVRESLDVLVGDGLVQGVQPAGTTDPAAYDTVHDLSGYLMLPATAEPHAHLDKALLDERVVNLTGDLAGAIEALHAAAPGMDAHDLRDRATRAALTALAHGTTAIRSHVDVGQHAGLRHLDALCQVREELAGLLDLQIVALVAAPTTGLAGRNNAALLRAALTAGADVAGGAPHLDPDPQGAMERCLAEAADAGLPVDLHTDETLDPTAVGLEALARHVLRSGFPHGVTASHCVSLGTQDAVTAARVAAAVAEAGIGVVTLPQTNLFLQGRGVPTATPRGLTAVRALLDAGALVAAGGDNVRDPFNPMGRGDALETASLLVTAGHLLPGEALTAVTDAARRVLGLPPTGVRVGSPADLVAVRAGSVTGAIAAASQDRIVLHAGRIVARTRVERTFPTRASIPAAV